MEEEQEIKIEKKKLINKLKENPWMISTAVFALVSLILLIMALTGGITGKVVSESSASQGREVEIISIDREDQLYKVTLDIGQGPLTAYVTLDGKYLLSQPIPLDIPEIQQQEPEIQEIPKTDKPEVELFVMSFCPYGTQSEKGIIPTIKTLGDSVDAKIRFVHYFMHGDKEEQETYRQVCIREEQGDKFLAYLTCFLEDGDSNRCLSKARINKSKLNSCVDNKAEYYYAKDSELSQSYGVQGSPTLVVNGIVTVSNVRNCPRGGEPCAVYPNLGRSSQAYLDTICQAFNTEPEECEEELSSQTFSPGFGYSETGNPNTAQC